MSLDLVVQRADADLVEAFVFVAATLELAEKAAVQNTDPDAGNDFSRRS